MPTFEKTPMSRKSSCCGEATGRRRVAEESTKGGVSFLLGRGSGGRPPGKFSFLDAGRRVLFWGHLGSQMQWEKLPWFAELSLRWWPCKTDCLLQATVNQPSWNGDSYVADLALDTRDLNGFNLKHSPAVFVFTVKNLSSVSTWSLLRISVLMFLMRLTWQSSRSTCALQRGMVRRPLVS